MSRNLREYPITADEVLKTVQGAGANVSFTREGDIIVGGQEASILAAIHHLLEGDPAIMQKLLDSLKV